jgi:cyclopropane fatty-acyl-phospholipid synthase-like methyltransferase
MLPLQVPTEYFVLVLGRHLKYSCCLYNNAGEGLNEAERNMLGGLRVSGFGMR